MAASRTNSPTGKPKRAVVDRRLAGRLSARVGGLKPLPDGQWAILHEFIDFPRQAYWYRFRLNRKHPAVQFTASIEPDGVGRLYARLAPAD